MFVLKRSYIFYYLMFMTASLNPKFASDNKLCWKTMTPLFSNKGSYNANIKPTEKDEIIQYGEKVVEPSNGFLKNAISSLKLNENSFVINDEHKHSGLN